MRGCLTRGAWKMAQLENFSAKVIGVYYWDKILVICTEAINTKCISPNILDINSSFSFPKFMNCWQKLRHFLQTFHSIKQNCGQNAPEQVRLQHSFWSVITFWTVTEQSVTEVCKKYYVQKDGVIHLM